MSLTDAMTADGASSLSSFAGVILMACIFGRTLTHLHRADDNDHPEDLNRGEFWRRHRHMDKILLNTSMFLPEHLRVPAGVKDANVVFLNMNLHTAKICLHQAAISKAEKHDLGAALIRHSSEQCVSAADETISIMRMISHIDLTNVSDGLRSFLLLPAKRLQMHPFMAFCLYVAARVYVQAFIRNPDDQVTGDALDSLLTAMHALKQKNPLTESFLAQLMVDLEGTEFGSSSSNSRFSFNLKKHAVRLLSCVLYNMN